MQAWPTAPARLDLHRRPGDRAVLLYQDPKPGPRGVSIDVADLFLTQDTRYLRGRPATAPKAVICHIRTGDKRRSI
jgi:hypothetical protein